MTALPKQKYTLEEYFELERQSKERFEYFDGEVISKLGFSEKKDALVSNLICTFKVKFQTKHCRVFLANMRLKVPSLPPYRYSDGSALCGEAVFEKNRRC
jgi:Uma2 family endonuclease